MPVELIIATFEDENKAEELMKRIKELEKQKSLKVKDIAAIIRPKEGEVRVMDIGDVTPKRGAVFGAITGGLLGLMVGPVGAIVMALTYLADQFGHDFIRQGLPIELPSHKTAQIFGQAFCPFMLNQQDEG